MEYHIHHWYGSCRYLYTSTHLAHIPFLFLPGVSPRLSSPFKNSTRAYSSIHTSTAPNIVRVTHHSALDRFLLFCMYVYRLHTAGTTAVHTPECIHACIYTKYSAVYSIIFSSCEIYSGKSCCCCCLLCLQVFFDRGWRGGWGGINNRSIQISRWIWLAITKRTERVRPGVVGVNVC